MSTSAKKSSSSSVNRPVHVSIAHTGCLDGWYLKACPESQQNKDTVIQVRRIANNDREKEDFDDEPITKKPRRDVEKSSPPKQSNDDLIFKPQIKEVQNLTDIHYRDHMQIIPFFHDIPNVEDRKRWIADCMHQSDEYLSDRDDIEIRFLSIGGEVFNRLDTTVINQLMDGQYRPIREVYLMIPGKKAGTSAARHTLVFRPTIWTYMNIEDTLPPPKLFLDLAIGNLTKERPSDGENSASTPSLRSYKCQLGISDTKKVVIQIFDDNTSGTISRESAEQMMTEYCEENGKNVEKIRNDVSKRWFTPGYYKSLLQKLIRTKCDGVRLFSGEVVPASDVFVIVVLELFLEPGSFVPDIQRFVSGVESAFKRLGVSATEDSFAADRFVVTVLGAALVAQQHSSWKPSTSLVRWVLRRGAKCRADPRCFAYTKDTPDETKMKHQQWKAAYLLLKELRSFQGDMNLLGQIAINEGKERNLSDVKPSSYIMPIEHCIDQHCVTEVAHFFPLEKNRGNSTFDELFQYVWKRGTSRNGRLEALTAESIPEDIRCAQRLLWMAKSTLPVDRECSRNSMGNIEEEVMPYKIHESWIAGLVGTIEVNIQQRRVWVFVHPEDIYRLVAMRAPSRSKAEELDDNLRDEAIEAAREKLKKGVKVNNEFLGVSGTVYLRTVTNKSFIEDEEFDNNNRINVMNDKEEEGGDGVSQEEEYVFEDGRQWNNMCQGMKRIPIYDDDDVNTSMSLTQCVTEAYQYSGSNCVVRNCLARISSFLSRLSKEILHRLQMYVRPIQNVIEIYRISRDGSSTYLTVSWKDTGVFHALLQISVLAPAVVKPLNNFKFLITDFSLWNEIRARICELATSFKDNNVQPMKTLGNGVGSSCIPWPESCRFHDQRKLFTHQQAAVDQIKFRFQTGRRGNLIWIPVGLGKTLIVTTVVGWLMSMNELPPYVVYSLPSSAIDSVSRELEMGNLPYVVLDYRGAKSKKGAVTIQRNKVNLIRHDHMRMAGDNGSDLIAIASEMLFIIDEFHLTLNETKRTSIALELAKLSVNFIGMSGTLIKDNSPSGVIEWVSQVVDFQVTPQNYWVAVAALISRKTVLGIIENRQFIQIDMSVQERERYDQYVEPRFGGKAVRTIFRSAVDVCYQVIYRKMFELALQGTSNKSDKPLFVVCKDNNMQANLARDLSNRGRNVFCISAHQSITLTPQDKRVYDIILTTSAHSTGYTLTQCEKMITAVYFSNQATRDQLEGRLLRVGQVAKEVQIIILHTGILSYTLNHYEDARSMNKALQDLAETVIM